MCHEMGIDTGIDLDELIECAKLAEDYRRPSAARLGDEGRNAEAVPAVALGGVGHQADDIPSEICRASSR